MGKMAKDRKRKHGSLSAKGERQEKIYSNYWQWKRLIAERSREKNHNNNDGFSLWRRAKAGVDADISAEIDGSNSITSGAVKN